MNEQEFMDEMEKNFKKLELIERKKETNRKWRANNPEKVKIYQKKWRANNPEKLKEINRKSRKKYIETNPKKYKIMNKRYQKTHRDNLTPEETKLSRLYWTKWKLDNPEKVKQYQDRSYAKVKLKKLLIKGLK